MKFQKSIYFILLLSVFFTACKDDDNHLDFEPIDIYENYTGEVFQINFYKMKSDKAANEVKAFLSDILPIVESQNGQILTSPIQITEPLIQNAGLPSVVRSFDYDFVLLFQFSDEDAYQLAVNDQEYINLRNDFENANTDEAVETVNLLPPPPSDGSPIPPVFGSVSFRPSPPSFLLLNLGQFIQTPEAQQSLNEYFMLQVPRAIQAETVFTNQFVNTIVQRGDFVPTDLISFTEWKDQAAFDLIHEDSNAVENIFPLRNNALMDMVEARAVILD